MKRILKSCCAQDLRRDITIGALDYIVKKLRLLLPEAAVKKNFERISSIRRPLSIMKSAESNIRVKWGETFAPNGSKQMKT